MNNMTNELMLLGVATLLLLAFQKDISSVCSEPLLPNGNALDVQVLQSIK